MWGSFQSLWLRWGAWETSVKGYEKRGVGDRLEPTKPQRSWHFGLWHWPLDSSSAYALLGAAHQLRYLLSDRRLAGSVILQGKLADQRISITRGGIHGHHAG